MAVTESEAYLESLARKSFLSMWSYPNPVFGNHASGKAGKELCDLLVLFRDNIILFSDKSCKYPNSADPILNWNRWYKRSITKSVDQLIGAKKTLSRSTNDIFTDMALHTRFPLPLPDPALTRYFLIAVSHGCGPECRCEYGRNSLEIDTRISPNNVDHLTVGYHFDGHCVHILDDSTLDIILKNRDTIVDFIHYLEQKEAAFAESDFVIHGEENLLANYVLNRDFDGNHCITTSAQTPPVVIHDGAWNDLVDSECYQHSQEENRISYNMDMLIEHFTNSYLTNQMIEGQQESLSYHEQALRMMASENRFGRRTISTALVSILREEVTTTFWATTVPSFATEGLRYVFLTYPNPPDGMSLEQCEQYILNYLSQHLLVARHVFTESTTLIGIALPNSACRMTTLFIRILDGKNWTSKDHHEASEIQKATGIFTNMEEEQYLHFE